MIYFVQLPSGSIKIGTTENLDQRVMTLNNKGRRVNESANASCQSQ